MLNEAGRSGAGPAPPAATAIGHTAREPPASTSAHTRDASKQLKPKKQKKKKKKKKNARKKTAASTYIVGVQSGGGAGQEAVEHCDGVRAHLGRNAHGRDSSHGRQTIQ